MYLEKRPTIFTKDGQIKEVFHTVRADELKKLGWVVQGEDETETTNDLPGEPDPAPDSAPDSAPEAEANPEELEAIQEIEAEEELRMMLETYTKDKLITFAEEKGIKVDPHAKKANIIEKIVTDIDDVELGR